MGKKNARTSEGLRDILFDEIEHLRGPDSDPQRSNSIINACKTIVSIARAELEFHEKMNKDEKICDDFMTGELRLGSRGDNADN